MDLVERYCARTCLLLRLINPEDLGHLVDREARIEICRVLKLTEPRNHFPLESPPANIPDEPTPHS